MALFDDRSLVREKLDFTNAEGTRLAALLESPPSAPRAYALFAHCFTCSKDIAAASRVSRALAARGIATLRFDFTGLGNSDGDFANTNFSSNVADLVAAADHMREHFAAPQLLVGHSLGGAAVLAAAGQVPEARAVATIGAPADPSHVAHLFSADRDTIEREGEAEVDLAGRRFTIRRQFLEDIESQRLADAVAGLRKALLVLHAPLDTTVGIDNASSIFAAAKHPKSFVSLDKADHLVSNPADSRYAAATIAAWAERYLDDVDTTTRPSVADGEVLVRERDGGLTQDVFTDRHHLIADEPQRLGGADLGPSPYEYLMAGLGACTTMTLRMYARHKKIPLEGVEVRLVHGRIHAEDCASCETQAGKVDRIERRIRVEGSLSEEQRAGLTRIADRCPVHRSLHSEILIETELDE